MLGLVAVVTVYAQFDPQMGQYMYMPTAFNPAAAGEGDLMKVIMLKTDFGPGERHSVCWHYIETESADEWKAPDHMWFTVETR